MRRDKLHSLSSKGFNFKDWKTLESSRISKDSATASFHNKSSSSHISKYSVSREAQMHKRLHTELKNHGDSIIYNFKRLEHQSSDPIPETESPRFITPKLPSLTPLAIKSKRDHQNSNNTQNLSSFSLSKSRFIELDSSRTHTSQLEEKVKSFLRPQEIDEAESALRSYDTEVSSFRERYRQQNDFISKVLKISDADIIDRNLKELTTKNILTTNLRKKIEGLDSKAAHKILQKAGVTEEQLTLKSVPKHQSVDIRIKKFKNELNPDYHTINSYFHPSDKSESPSHAASKSKDYGSILQTSKTHRDRLEARVYDFNKLTNRQLTSMVEEAKGTLDTKLAPFRLATKGLENGNVQRIGASRGSQIRFQNPSRRQTERLSMIISKRNRPVNIELLKKFGSVIKRLVNKMLRLGLTPDEVAVQSIFPKGPLERKEAHSLINLAKKGDYKGVKNLLRINKYLVYDYDNTYQTALHWAAKRGHNAIVKLLLEYKADPDAVDLSKRTSLFFAAKGHHLISLKLLLYHAANPMLRSVRGKLAVDYAGSNEIIKLYLRKAFRMHLILGHCAGRKLLERWGRMDKTEFQVAEYDIDYFQ